MSDQHLIVAIPLASFEDLAATLEGGGHDFSIITQTDDGRTVAGLDLGNVTLTPIADKTDFIGNADAVEDAMKFACEEAHKHGFNAGKAIAGDHDPQWLSSKWWEAWSAYEPSENVKDAITSKKRPEKSHDAD